LYLSDKPLGAITATRSIPVSTIIPPRDIHSIDERYPVKTIVALFSALILSFPAFATDNACMSQATEKKLSGAAKNSFTKKCVRDGCEATSLDKKLSGAAKNSFTKKCVADGLQPFCEEQAAGKKLSGAAKTSFMNKCQAGN